MTIDDVMSCALAFTNEAADGRVQLVGTRAENELRAAILALLDAEAEACAALSDAEDSAIKASIAIRARIAARRLPAKRLYADD